MKKPFGSFRSIWDRVTEHSDFQPGVDLPWEQEDAGPEPQSKASARRKSEPFVNHDLPLSAGLQEVERRLEELRKLQPIKEEAKL